MLLSTIAGEPFTLESRVDLERNDPTSLEAVNWLHVVAFIFTAAIVVDLPITLSRVGIRASRGAVRRP